MPWPLYTRATRRRNRGRARRIRQAIQEAPSARLYLSHYNAHWRGIILARHQHANGHYLLLLLPLIDQHGKPMRRRELKVLAETWVEDTKEDYDLSTVNPDWLDSYALQKRTYWQFRE
jgi:hypothetical protein